MCREITLHSTYRGKNMFNKLTHMEGVGLVELVKEVRNILSEYKVSQFSNFFLIVSEVIGKPPTKTREINNIKVKHGDEVLAEFKLEVEESLTDHLELE